jgi:hypothetical protein
LNSQPQHRKLPPSKTSSEKSIYEVGLGNRLPTMDKLMQLIGIILLFLVGLSGSEYIIGKKWAKLSITRIAQLCP